jgi:hypothetical protein
VPIKCFFDGGNQADPKQYKTMTLCAVAGTGVQWTNIEKQWATVLSIYEAPFIHTSDMLTLNEPFTVTNGWSHPKVHALLTDCVRVIDRCKAKPEDDWPHGIMPVSITIVLDDFKRAVAEIPVLGRPELHCAIHCLQMCGHWCDAMHVNTLQLVFDQNEPFHGHLSDRWKSRRAGKEETIWEHVIAMTEADSREVPGLQVADLIAWSVGKQHDQGIKYDWQRQLLAIHKEKVFYDYQKLKLPDVEALECLGKWKIPQRKPFGVV